MLSFAEARTRLLTGVARVGSERVPLGGGLGRVLARSLVARGPFPAFSASAMDGYAVSLSDLAGEGPWTLDVRGESRTGSPAPELERGCACRIFTGAAIPTGSDSVIMQEDVTREGDRITFSRLPKGGAHIRRKGEDLRAGDEALAAGVRLGPGHLALAASLDHPELEVARRPVVTIVCTGDELRAVGEPPRPASIPESNAVALAAMAERAGAFARTAPLVGDDPDATTLAVEDALRGSDLVLTVGGVSVGDHDVVRPALERAGVTLDFWKVAIKPGKPLVVGRAGARYVLGLPGNPASAMVTFALFGVPLLRSMQGDANPLPMLLRAKLASAVTRKPGRLEFLRATLEVVGGELAVVPLANQASGAVTSMAWGDVLALIEPEVASLPEGTMLDVLRLGDV
jgi:molybdopterin molybdotransferase